MGNLNLYNDQVAKVLDLIPSSRGELRRKVQTTLLRHLSKGGSVEELIPRLDPTAVAALENWLTELERKLI